jgi:replication factor C large subunit
MIQQENIPWVEKHRVRRFVELKGQEMAVNRVKEFLKSFPKKKAIVLHGPPGTGKTSLAYAIAVENDCEILEMNASDLRNKQKVSEVIGPASQQKSLFRKGKIILVDEVDGISTKDRGGLSELLSLISSTNFPVIITANDIWQQKFSELRRKTELVQMKDIDYKDINSLLQKICEKENVVVSQDVLTSISIKSRGDVRAAINDLQILSKSDEPLLMKDMGDRNREQSILFNMCLRMPN